MSDWEEEIEVEIAVPLKKNKWEDEDVEEDLKDDWELSDDEEEKKKKEEEAKKRAAAPIRKKVGLKQKIAEKQAAEEQKKKELEAKKAAAQEEAEEGDYERQQRMRQLELEADMANATDLFSGVSLSDITDKPLEEVRPKNRVEFDAYRKRLVELITPYSKSINFGWFIDDLLRDIAFPLNHQEVKKVSSSLTVIANEKQRAAKEAQKKTKGKSRPQLAAAGKVASKDAYEDTYDDYDDFM
ncbi:eukaryotic translation initiation factor 3 subunit J [Mycotypha africana]|uniref:eukaryotic translation initiation factor 3 subunit J n=1 Tax=Mycotypha africana TaxID=64632 RepID=UPI002301C9FA|nr:eukaryotic translation initiation factor 3 subunit J [Mycotypha africana]KAI8975416.1 eukaryotic translation initiation factor 3 subunit J [Mycotypha africana]